MNVEWIGLVAGALTSAGFVPQVMRSLRTRHVADLSVWQPIVLLVGMCVWLTYGILLESPAIILTNIFSIAMNLALVFLKFRYQDAGEKHV